MTTMDIGVVQMPVDPWPVTIERTRELEAIGFDHVWLYDHLSWKHYRDEPWQATIPWLTGMAAGTERIRLGTMVASPTLRHPLMLAKEAMSLDHISGGRLILGVGAGGAGFDATAYGDAPLSPGQRAERFEEYATVLDGLLRGELTDHEGRWYTVDGGRILPGCVQRPRVPLALAAGGARTIGLVATVADAFITLGDPLSPPASPDDYVAVVTEQADRLDASCADLGRDPSEIERIGFIPTSFSSALASLDTFVDLAGSLADAGFGAVVIHDHRGDDPALDVGADLIDAIGRWRLAEGQTVEATRIRS